MTAPTAVPGGGADPGAGAGTGSQPAGGAGGETGQQAGSDYLGRVRGDPDFAVSELRKHQSRADQVEGQLRTLRSRVGENLEQLVGQAGGDAVATAVSHYLTLKSDPRYAQALQALETTGRLPVAGGRDPSGGQDPEEEYLSPEQREIRELKAQLNSVSAQQGDLILGVGQQALQAHLDRFAADNPLNPGEVEAMKKSVIGEIQRWAGQGELGRKAIANLQNPGSYETVRRLLLGALPQETLDDLGNRKARRRQQRLEGMATDDPSPNSSLNEPPPPGLKTTLDVLRYYQAHPEKAR
jgi:hypothetical protein